MMNIVLLLLLLSSLAACSAIRRNSENGVEAVAFLQFELYCLKYAVDRAVMSIRISKSRPSAPSSSPSIQVVLESMSTRISLRRVYAVPQKLGELDVVLPAWAMEPQVVTKVVLENSRTGSAVSGDLEVEFRRECMWPKPPSSEQHWVMDVSNDRTHHHDVETEASLLPPPNQWF